MVFEDRLLISDAISLWVSCL